jgi:hypothetical protein
MNDEIVSDPIEAGKAKLDELSSRDFAPRVWHENLWANVPAAIAWANSNPICQAGEIIFNIRDNGQVWTYTLF